MIGPKAHNPKHPVFTIPISFSFPFFFISSSNFSIIFKLSEEVHPVPPQTRTCLLYPSKIGNFSLSSVRKATFACIFSLISFNSSRDFIQILRFYSYFAKISSISSTVKRPYTSSFTMTTGANPQAPTQRHASNENFPSGVHSPPFIPSFSCR